MGRLFAWQWQGFFDLSMYNIIFILRACCILYCVHFIVSHYIGMCRMRRFLAVLRIFFHSSLLYNLPFHTFRPTSLPSFLTSSFLLFLGLPLSLVASKFIYTSFGILFSTILCTCPNQRNVFNLIISLIVGFLTFINISFG